MHAALPFPFFSNPFPRPAELRVDVDPSEDRGTPLAELYARLRRRGDRLHGLPAFRLHDPRFNVHVRSVGGELHAYVEDMQRQCLAGCTVFNRLAEVDRRADRHLRSPHSRYLPAYQRLGIATAIYDWALGQGICLMTGARQSAGAHALWRSLARRHEAGFVEIRDRRITFLGRDVTPDDLQRLGTRMFLLPPQWSLPRFLAAVGVRTPQAPTPSA
ncbi:MAG TPA: N-acetyltransferase [Burkholderiaceae bacterium]|nr:N-acetyltransferase [Burkholderiaceae bacterium]